jgi:stearoyl-CoA desaturase (delta-9 desaturase)
MTIVRLMPGAKLCLKNFSCLSAAHLLAALAIAYLALADWPWQTLATGLFWLACCGLAITSGYHRLFAHRAYAAVWPVRLFYLLFGAASLQNSALDWCADHRIHHRRTDKDDDPYDITKGFWWAHIGWIVFEQGEERNLRAVADLRADWLIQFQHRNYPVLAISTGFAIPAALGMLWDDPLGSMLVCGFLRVVVQWHATFSVNSLAHMFGTQPYTTDVSARDCWMIALVTLGEGYHNYHHRFPTDYRNGIRWFHFDPTKWFVWSLSALHLAWGLRRAPPHLIARAQQRVIGAASPPNQR